MKIRSVEPIEVAAPADELSSPWSSTVVLVKVVTSTGAVGWGEAPTTLMTHPVRASVPEVARFYEGHELHDFHACLREFERYSFYRSRSMEATSALSAVDIACHDLLGRELGTPVSSLLGGAIRDRVRAYSNGWYSDCIAPEEFAEKAHAMVTAGFRALKFDPFGDQYRTLSPEGLAAAVAHVEPREFRIQPARHRIEDGVHEGTRGTPDVDRGGPGQRARDWRSGAVGLPILEASEERVGWRHHVRTYSQGNLNLRPYGYGCTARGMVGGPVKRPAANVPGVARPPTLRARAPVRRERRPRPRATARPGSPSEGVFGCSRK